LGEEPMHSEKEIALDLLLDKRRVHAKFGCTGSYRVQMHKEQTDKHSSLYIRLNNSFQKIQTNDVNNKLIENLLK
jgi:hypothetical protein